MLAVSVDPVQGQLAKMHPFPVTNEHVLFPCEQKGRRYEAVKWMVVFAIGVCTGLVSSRT